MNLLVLLLCVIQQLGIMAVPSLESSAIVVVPPLYPQSPDARSVAFILMGDTETNSNMYQALVESVQNSFFKSYSVWFALVPANAGQKLVAKGAKSFLSNHAFPSDGSVFLLGHGQGGLVAQTTLVHLNHSVSDINALILVGSNLARKYVSAIHLPVLTVCGEYDGLATPFRCAESFYFAKSSQSVALIEDMNHSSFLLLDETAKNSMKWLKQDLNPPALSLDTTFATSRMTSVLFSFVNHIIYPSLESEKTMDSITQKSELFFRPLIAALNLEGNYQLRRPCDSDHPSPHCPFYPQYPMKTNREASNDTTCRCESSFTQEAVQVFFERNSSFYKIANVDAFHYVSQVKPIHHPHIWSNCSSPSHFPCVINMTTITENVYQNDDQAEVPGTPVAATEIRMKLKSWQSVLDVTTNPGSAHTLNFDETDPLSVCQSLNKYSLQRALNFAPKHKVDYWNQHGMPLEFDLDQDSAIEPLFTFTSLHETVVNGSDGRKIKKIKSPSFRVALDNLVAGMVDTIGEVVPGLKDFKGALNGYHYCKVVSPARVLEWIYTDGLRF